MASKLAELLFRDYRRRVLSLLLMHADKRYHVREIARLTDTVAGTGERSEGLLDTCREFTAKRQLLVKNE